jgi:hypothetical protein
MNVLGWTDEENCAVPNKSWIKEEKNWQSSDATGAGGLPDQKSQVPATPCSYVE